MFGLTRSTCNLVGMQASMHVEGWTVLQAVAMPWSMTVYMAMHALKAGSRMLELMHIMTRRSMILEVTCGIAWLWVWTMTFHVFSLLLAPPRVPRWVDSMGML